MRQCRRGWEVDAAFSSGDGRRCRVGGGSVGEVRHLAGVDDAIRLCFNGVDFLLKRGWPRIRIALLHRLSASRAIGLAVVDGGPVLSSSVRGRRRSMSRRGIVKELRICCKRSVIGEKGGANSGKEQAWRRQRKRQTEKKRHPCQGAGAFAFVLVFKGVTRPGG